MVDLFIDYISAKYVQRFGFDELKFSPKGMGYRMLKLSGLIYYIHMLK